MTPCRLVNYRKFTGSCCLHFKGLSTDLRRWRWGQQDTPNDGSMYDSAGHRPRRLIFISLPTLRVLTAVWWWKQLVKYNVMDLNSAVVWDLTPSVIWWTGNNATSQKTVIFVVTVTITSRTLHYEVISCAGSLSPTVLTVVVWDVQRVMRHIPTLRGNGAPTFLKVCRSRAYVRSFETSEYTKLPATERKIPEGVILKLCLLSYVYVR
jgi:hypothetical protein